jgi:hypothetical protein
MPSVEFTRPGDQSIADQLAEMQRWLDHEGIPVSDLRALCILSGHVTYSAKFDDAADASRFVKAFGDQD